ncbi:MAG TPA: hypothetical protein DIU35_18105 [Candidatus Latescibacteria bacterium]|nr:hypothetical protein [Candidatus Latescibacterota bacterium]
MPADFGLEGSLEISFRFRDLVLRYNRVSGNLIQRYTGLLQMAHEAQSIYRKQLLETGRLFIDTGSVQSPNTEDLARSVRSEFQPLPQLPENLEERIRINHRSVHPPFWRRRGSKKE